jgi:DNA polymerase-3 subunit alpha
LFGLGSIKGINRALATEIINKAPYSSFKDFNSKIKTNVRQMLGLIKAGAFNNFGDRTEIMYEYLEERAGLKKKLTLQNFNGLIEADLLPPELNGVRAIFLFNKAIKKFKLTPSYYEMVDQACEAYAKYDFPISYVVKNEEDKTVLDIKLWDAFYKQAMEKIAKKWLKENHDTVLADYNNYLIELVVGKYGIGSEESWEIDSLGVYNGKHELDYIDLTQYSIVDYNTLPAEPVVESVFKRGAMEIPIYKLSTIVGTVISKDNIRHTITLLTPTGPVDVKMYKDQYAHFKQQISVPVGDNKKRIAEKSWFTTGTKLMITGMRRGNQFVAKTYKSTSRHTIYKCEINNGALDLVWERYSA